MDIANCFIANCFICHKPLVRSTFQTFTHLDEYACNGNGEVAHCRQYVNIYTKQTRYYIIQLDNFYVYYYCDDDYPLSKTMPINTVYVYHNKFPAGSCTQQPFLKLSPTKVDLNKIVSYNHRWKVLNTFS